MQAEGLAIMCLQETRIPASGTRIVETDFVLITSGADDGKRTFAGVCFLIAPWVRRSVCRFKAVSERLSCLKLRIYGGKAIFFNVYAPHGGYDYQTRQELFAQVGEIISATRSYGPRIIAGDCNSRIQNNIGGEDDVLGPYCFGNPDYNPELHPDTNRELLLEMCHSNGL